MDLMITETLIIPSKEIKWRFSRSSGPGGQNVNKIETRVEIIFNIENSKVLNDFQKKCLRINLSSKLVNNSLCLIVQDYRNQLLNRKLALVRASSLIRKALFQSSKIRKPTKPSYQSRKKRIELKKKRGKLKKSRKIEKLYDLS